MLDSQLQEDHLIRYAVLFEKAAEGETAVVTFFDENNKKVTRLKLSVVPKEIIYHWILSGESVSLESAYVKDFSLSEFRELNQKKTGELVLIKNFNAQHTFFDCEATTDLSFALFEGNQLCLAIVYSVTEIRIFLTPILVMAMYCFHVLGLEAELLRLNP
jgi:hypothetical protein